MGKKALIDSLVGLIILLLTVTVAGCVVKAEGAGRIAPGIMLCGRDISGMRVEEVEELTGELLPDFVTEIRCRFLTEQRWETETEVRRLFKGRSKEEAVLLQEQGLPNRLRDDIRVTLQGNELCLIVKTPMLRILPEDTAEAAAVKSGEVRVWEWLYAKIMGRPFQIRQVEAVIVWEEEHFGELLGIFTECLERERTEAAVWWEKGRIRVKESKRGFRIDTEAAWADAERVCLEAIARLNHSPAEGIVLRLFLKGTALMPRLSTEQAQKCNTKIGEFKTSYAEAGEGRANNIAAGAKKLHASVVLPGDEFSTAASLRPFTEESGYVAGGTFINGELSESMGGGVCQLSTTLYNALLYTDLEITKRYPHSVPVGYIPPGRDAAIAGDYKDLCFRNNTGVPVLLLCEADGETVTVTLYGAKEAAGGEVEIESVVTEETGDRVTAEVYRTGRTEEGVRVREKISVDKYRRFGTVAQLSDGSGVSPEKVQDCLEGDLSQFIIENS